MKFLSDTEQVVTHGYGSATLKEGDLVKFSPEYSNEQGGYGVVSTIGKYSYGVTNAKGELGFWTGRALKLIARAENRDEQ